MEPCVSTYRPPRPRLDRDTLDASLHVLLAHPWVDALVASVNGLLAILNDHRQILAVNESFSGYLGVADTAAAFGLRPGEALGCGFSTLGPEGCGTGPMCSTCGAAVALAATEGLEGRSSSRCVIQQVADGKTTDLCFRVRATPFDLGHQRYVVLVLDDISEAERWASLQRAFFHDLGNLVQGLVGTCEVAELAGQVPRDLIGDLKKGALGIADEIALNRQLCHGDLTALAASRVHVSTTDVIDTAVSYLASHGATASTSIIKVDGATPPCTIETIPSLVQRILVNMLLNAAEASQGSDPVRIWTTRSPSTVAFHVWNREVIPPGIAARIFRRYVTTKGAAGRGVGTFAMRLIGEEVLGGSVSFVSSADEGTTFTFTLPLR